MKGLEKCKKIQYPGEDIPVVPFRKSNFLNDLPEFTRSKLKMETPEQCVKTVQS